MFHCLPLEIRTKRAFFSLTDAEKNRRNYEAKNNCFPFEEDKQLSFLKQGIIRARQCVEYKTPVSSNLVGVNLNR